MVAAERQHRERIAPDLTDGPCRRGRRFGSHCRRFIDAFFPSARFDDQWHGIRASRAEDECGDRHTRWVIPFRIERWTLLRRHGESRIGMRRLASAAGCPRLPLPIGQMRGRLLRQTFPPDIAVIGQRNVGEDHVRPQRVHRIRI